MTSIEFKPLKSNIVTMHQLYRGECKKFIEYVLRDDYHCFEFELSDEDGRTIFREMKSIAKDFPWISHYSSNHGSWFFQIQRFAMPVLYKRNGKYILQVNSHRY